MLFFLWSPHMDEVIFVLPSGRSYCMFVFYLCLVFPCMNAMNVCCVNVLQRIVQACRVDIVASIVSLSMLSNGKRK